MSQKQHLLPLLLAGAVSLLASCSKDKVTPTPVTPTDSVKAYTVPATYTFDNTEYKESAARISMWVGYTGYLGKGNVRVLTLDSANAMWNNSGAKFSAEVASGIPYTYDVLNTLSYNLSGSTTDAALIKKFADSAVEVSKFNTQTASAGVPGKIGTRLFNYSGLEFNQAVAKGMMGATVLYNINTIFNKVATDDNKTVVTGQGTAMQHDWDVAFGYVGIPKDYDTSKAYTSAIADRPLGVGGYFAERGKYIQAGGRVYEAFRKGRAAIGGNDYKVRDSAIATIRLYIEKTLAAAMYNYVTAPQTQTALDSKFHGLSEGYGFAVALKYRHSSSPLTTANYETLMSIMNTSFYELAADANNTKLKQAQSILTAAYGQLQP